MKEAFAGCEEHFPAMAVHTFAPPMESFRNGRDFAAWVGLTPRESSTGGRQRMGRIWKMRQRDIRKPLALGDTSASCRPAPPALRGAVGSHWNPASSSGSLGAG